MSVRSSGTAESRVRRSRGVGFSALWLRRCVVSSYIICKGIIRIKEVKQAAAGCTFNGTNSIIVIIWR
jgi:hypothetical protein